MKTTLSTLLLALVVGCSAPSAGSAGYPAPAGPATRAPSPAAVGVARPVGTPLPAPVWQPPQVQVPASGCQYRTAPNGSKLPDPKCTPGAVNPNLTAAVICAPDFRTTPYRTGAKAYPAPITQAQKNASYKRYGIGAHNAGDYEVDHLLSLEDGGSDADANLWPQPSDALSKPAPGFNTKDQIETLVHNDICAGLAPMDQAQQRLASDWTQFIASSGASLKALPPKTHTGDDEEAP